MDATLSEKILNSLAGIANQPQFITAPPEASRINCTKCRFSTRDSDAFERHWAQHAGVTFTCLICGHISYTKVESQRHNVQHSGTFPFKCGFCSYGAVRRDYVAKHIQRVHSKFVRNSQSQNVVIMGDVGAAQPLNIVPNLVPATLNQLQGTSSSTSNYNFGGELSKSVGTVPNQYQTTSLVPRVRVTAPADSLSTSLNLTKPSNQIISITPVRIPNTSNHTNFKYGTASGVMGTGPRQSAHTGAANASNMVKQPRATPNILRKSKQRPAASAPHLVNNGFPPGRQQPVSITGQVLPVRFHQPTGVAPSTLSVVSSQAMNRSTAGGVVSVNPSSFRPAGGVVSVNPSSFRPAGGVVSVNPSSFRPAGSVVSVNPSSFQARPNASLNTHQGSVGMAAKPYYVYKQPTSVPSNRVPSTSSQALAGNFSKGLVSVNAPLFRPTPGASPNQPAKRVSSASGVGSVYGTTNRFGNTVGSSLNTQSRVTGSQVGSNPALSSLLSSGPLGTSGNSLSHKTNAKGLPAPVQVELLEPLHQQPIYEQTLTVSYPEKMNIRPGSLVELVNVNMVNGTQELQFRVLPEQSLGSSEKNAAQPTPAVGTAFKDGMLTVGPGSSRDKRLSSTEASPRTKPNPVQAFPVSNDALPQISCVPTTKINTCGEKSVVVKEEPSEYASGLALSQEQNKAHQSSVAPESQPTSLPTIGITIRKKENTYSSTSFAVSRPATSDPQNSDIEIERETLPVISSVFSLGEGPQVERGPFTGSSAKSLGASIPVQDRVGSLLVPCAPTEEVIELFQTKDANVEPPAQNRTVHLPGRKANQPLQASTLQTQTMINSGLNTVHHGSSGSLSSPMLGPNVHKPAVAHPPPLQSRGCTPDLDAKERTICGVHISGFSPQSYKQLFTMVPRVRLTRISKENPSTHCHSILKLRLKRKICESEDDPSDIFEALALPLTEASTEPFGGSDRSEKKDRSPGKRRKLSGSVDCCRLETEDDPSDISEALALPLTEASMEPFGGSDGSERKDRSPGKRRKLSGSVDCCRLYLTPVKEDQPVKWPRPNQPVVVLNHPHPHVLRWGGERSPQSPSDGRGVAPLRIVVYRDSHKVVMEPVKSPSLKMTFKKVEGEQYQVTELLAEGISSGVDL